MKTRLECFPCFLRQALDTAKLAGADHRTARRVLDEVARALPEFPLKASPPEMGRVIYRIVSDITGKADPYRAIKRKSNALALSIYPKLKKRVACSRDPLAAAVKLAIAGNIIDFGVCRTLNVEKELANILAKEERRLRRGSHRLFACSSLRRALRAGGDLLVIGDNAGESVFDRLLIETIREQFGTQKIFYAVRSHPVINDALTEDARACGIESSAEILESGSDAPGTVLSQCTPRFRTVFRRATVVISKGQGNFETLSAVRREIYFLLIAKCPVVAFHLGCRTGDVILHRRSTGSAKR